MSYEGGFIDLPRSYWMGVMKILHVTHQKSAVQMPLNEGILQGSEIRCPPHSGYHCRRLHTLLDSLRSITLFLSHSISFLSRHDQFTPQVTPGAEPKTERK